MQGRHSIQNDGNTAASVAPGDIAQARHPERSEGSLFFRYKTLRCGVYPTPIAHFTAPERQRPLAPLNRSSEYAFKSIRASK